MSKPQCEDDRKLVQTVAQQVAAEWNVLGGKLVCEKCGAEKSIENLKDYIFGHWPMCCGQPMTWVTDKGSSI